ncbi:MAG TPA: prenyltransferase/squalene oxidase repeat-containing protein [Candidatus Deferrimicrobium sp.]|nr:prenyltransferase/squalene oxidase repeat-containing protein [Candidatus Deferrimicrobium sp.]
MSEKKKNYKLIIGILIIFILPFSLLVGLILYKPPHHFQTSYINSIISETNNYALTFQNQDGLFVEPAIDVIYNTVATYFYLNGTTPFLFSDLNLSYISYFALTRQNLDGSFSDFAGSGDMVSTFKALMTINWTIPEELSTNPVKMNLTYTFLNESRNSDGGYSIRPPFEQPAEFNFDIGYGIPLENFSKEISYMEYTHEAVKTFSLLGITPPNAQTTTFFINTTCRRIFIFEPNFPAGFAATKYTLSPDLHSTYHGVAALSDLGYSKSDIDLFGNITRFIELCWNSTDGGFSMYPGNVSDVTSTYYGVVALTLLDYNFSTSLVINRTKIIEFVENSQNLDGGVGARNGLPSSFQSAHHAAATIKLLEYLLVPADVTPLFYWLTDHKAQNGLYGEKLVEAQYWGIRSAFLANNEGSLNRSSISAFLINCQNPNGGFGSVPNSTSTVVDTYTAIESLYLLNNLSHINTLAATQWLQSLQTEEGGFASIIGLNAFLQSYAPLYGFIADLLLNDSRPSSEATFFALAALSRLGASPLNSTSLRFWLLSIQNADGGFPFALGIRSDAVSSFYAVQSLALIRDEPFSTLSCIQFLKGCQVSDGGFTFYPMIGEYLNVSYLFISYVAARAIYLLATQPADVFGAMDWFLTCKDDYTSGYSDTPYFGSDLRNSPYLIDIVRELNIDQSFDPTSWIQTILWLLIIELAALSAFGVVKLSRKYRKDIVGMKRIQLNIEEYPAVHVKGLTIKVGKKVILEDVNMTLQHGEVLGVVGESGAGKSTFVKSILGTKGSSGEIFLYGFDIRKEKKRLKPIIGYVPQDLSKIYENFTVMENLLHFGKQYGLEEKEIIQRGGKILQDLGIFDKRDSLVSALSGGQRRRASIAVGMIHQPTLFILDEPTSGLDPIIREQLWITLLNLAEIHNTTLIVITHYPEESKFCTKVAIFGRKRGLIDFGPPLELINNLPGSGRALDVNLKESIAPISVDLLPILQKVPQIEFFLEEKKGSRYRIFSNLPAKTLRAILIQALGTPLIEITQSEATLVDYFRIKSLEVKD